MHIFTYCFPKIKDCSLLLFYFFVHETRVCVRISEIIFIKIERYLLFLQIQCFRDLTRFNVDFSNKNSIIASLLQSEMKSSVTFFFGGQLGSNRGYEGGRRKERVVKKK